MTLTDIINDTNTRIERLLNLYIEQQPLPSPTLRKAMLYSLKNGGKRIRPLLVYLIGYVLDIPFNNLDAPAFAIELIHTYSLIHDDLPAMDNADMRRGLPSCHKAFDEALAILAGDAMQPLACNILATHPCELSTNQRLKMISILMEASGAHGMVAGQALDLAGSKDLESLKKMYALKTGALLLAATRLGMEACAEKSFGWLRWINSHVLRSLIRPSATFSHKGGRDCDVESALENFAEKIGLAYQIQDDLLDYVEHQEEIGKPVGIDVANNKLTFPLLLGIENARAETTKLYQEAITPLAKLGPKAEVLKEFAQHLLQRKK